MWSREDLVTTLMDLGLLRSPDLLRACRSVGQEAFLPEDLALLAYADQPLPFSRSLCGPTMPSARCLVTALELLEPTRDTTVLVEGASGAYAAAILSHVAGSERVVLVEPDAARRETLERRMAAAGLEAIRVVREPPERRFDRILVLDPSIPRPRDLASHLADLGFLIARGRGVEDLAFVKVVRRGPDVVRLTIGQPAGPEHTGPRRKRAPPPVDYARLFAVEDLLVHAWEGRVMGHYDQHFQDVVEETFADGPLDLEAFESEAEPRKLAARRAFQAGYILQSAGDLDRAEDAYARSLALTPSAEAHTFLGWTCSFEGRYEEAIDACRRAIDVDPTFGNPYNDIGAYLIELGRFDEAVSWLEKALAAPRYCCYFYAHANLARAYLQQGLREKARKHLTAALEANPEYEPARELLSRLDSLGGYFA